MKKTLYTGLELPPHLQTQNVTHCSFINIIPKPATDPGIADAFKNFHNYTHIIFTSKSAVRIFFDLLESFAIARKEVTKKTIISVGQRTAEKIIENGAHVNHIAVEETAEGITEILASLALEDAHILLPQSAIARPVITDWFSTHGITHTTTKIYDTISNDPFPLPDLATFHEIIFTSPSTIDAFMKSYGTLPDGIKLTCIGPVTANKLFSIKKD